MKRIGLMFLSALVMSSPMACQQVDPASTNKKLAEIEQKLAKIEELAARSGAPAAARPQRPPGPDASTVYAVPIEGAPYKGPEHAKVTVVKAFEFACPFCERARPTMAEIQKTYGDDVKIVYKHYVVHPGSATIPAHAVCAAAKQGKFGEMEALIWDKGFKANRNLGQENMDALAKELGLDMAKFHADMKETCPKVVQTDQSQMAKVGVRGTPGFFVNGRFIRGAQPFPVFKKLIDEELAKANERIKAGTPVEKYYGEWVMQKGKKEL